MPNISCARCRRDQVFLQLVAALVGWVLGGVYPLAAARVNLVLAPSLHKDVAGLVEPTLA